MRTFFFFMVIVLMLPACSVREITAYPAEKIVVGPGPEDMVLDRHTSEPRLLISCSSRRDEQGEFGEIIRYSVSNRETDTLIRTGMPDSLCFRPHGIYLVEDKQPALLYAISHEKDEGFHPVYIWELKGDTLLFRDLISSELLHSPNALTVDEDGSVYVVNDSGERGNMMEKILKLNRANIVRFVRSDAGIWEGKVVAGELGYPAGINIVGRHLYVGDAVNHELHVYAIVNGTLVTRDPIKNLRGNDNIRVIDNNIYLTGHVKPYRFIGHARSAKKRSPVEVWKINPETNEVNSIFYTDGSVISAGSTAIVYENKLYISQVFEPYIVKINLPE